MLEYLVNNEMDTNKMEYCISTCMGCVFEYQQWNIL